jgi:hypothetical protein
MPTPRPKSAKTVVVSSCLFSRFSNVGAASRICLWAAAQAGLLPPIVHLVHDGLDALEQFAGGGHGSTPIK